jgi:hypothetical protein
MPISPVGPEATNKRDVFFSALFEEMEGYVCIAAKKPGTERMLQEFFIWPDQKDHLLAYIEKFCMTHNVYYCPMTFTDMRRTKDSVKEAPCAWADLDNCAPDKLEETATFVIESSLNRFQALWKFEHPISAWDAEDISRRIYYKYAAEGVDAGGWDITQLLRTPFTPNHKYTESLGQAPIVTIHSVNGVSYSLEELQERLPQVVGWEALDIPMPMDDDLPEETADELLQKYKKTLQPLAFHLHSTVPERKKWSEALWQLEMFCIEGGMSSEETFVVARDSACNKYKRDGKSIVMLWKEVCRAKSKFDQQMTVLAPKGMGELLSDADRKACEANRTFVEEYIEWARTIGDAAPQYHQAGAFVLLSSLLAGPVRLPTSFGVVMPNLWFMILADTTLTRKSTAMDLAVDLLVEIDDNAIMATDGSIEGLMGALQFRPGRPSVFLRDEFSGLLEAMNKKDYYAGMAESFTKLYDGKFQKRILRRETIEVRDPVLILFAGGIRERILQLLQYEHVASGFLPRFIFIMAESDTSRLRPLGPPTEHTLEGRDRLQTFLSDLHNHYTADTIMTINGKQIAAGAEWRATLTASAWDLYNHYEQQLMDQALASQYPDLLTPMFDRLAKSGLKAAVLLACLDMKDRVEVDDIHLMKAFYYVEQWRAGSVDLLANIGRTTTERQVQLLMRAIVKEPGIFRSALMQRYHLGAREAEAALMTLEQRGQLQRVKSGRSETLHPTVVANQYT